MSKSAGPDNDTEWGRALERPVDADCEARPRPDNTTSIEHVQVAVVGGGLAGLAVAIGLLRQGFDVKVYERAPELRSESQGILSLQPNGLAALERIHPDIPRLVSEVGCERHEVVITTIDADGTITNKTTNVADESTTKYGRPCILITWHKMQQVLASLLPSDLVVTGRSLQRFEEDQDNVRLYFEDGSVVQATAFLACDGTFSAVRRQLYPEDSPIFFGQINWASIIETTKLPEIVHPPNAIHSFQYLGEPRWMAMLNDAGSGLTFWQLRVADSEKALSLSGNNGRGGLGLAGVKEALLPLAEPSQTMARVIEHIPESQIFERSICGCYPLSSWRSPGGRLALLGDSAHGMHPNIGQGANTAFESAAAAIDCIVDAAKDQQEVDWKAALETFERVRKPSADLVQQFANLMGVKQATGTALLSQAQVEGMGHWILRGERTLAPPADVVDVLKTFDPCDFPGVRPLW